MMNFNTANIGVVISSCFGFALFGYDGGLISGMLTNEYFLKTFNYPNEALQGQISGLFDLGCFFGALVIFMYGEKFGRKTVILVGCSIHIVGGALQCSAFSVPQLIIGRVIAGFGNGFITVAIPVWVSETTPADSRGGLLGLVLVFNMFGAVIVTFLNYGMRYVKSDVSFRLPLGLQCLFASASLLLVPFYPESPRWLISRGKNEQAKKNMALLYSVDEGSYELDEMYYDVIVHVEEEEAIARERKFTDLFRRDKLHNLRRIILGSLSQLMQQFGGNNTIMYYMPSLFQNSLGLSESLSLILAACNSLNVTICGAICALFVVDRVGRTKLMVGGSTFQGISMTMIGVGLAVGTTHSSILSIVFMFGFYTTFGFTWGFMAWTYPPEINSQQYRSVGAAIATATNWISNYIVVLITPIGVANIQWRYFILFAAFNFAFIPIIVFFFEETKGLALEQVDELFLRKNLGSSTQPVVEDKETSIHVGEIKV